MENPSTAEQECTSFLARYLFNLSYQLSVLFWRLLSCYVGAPDSLSHGSSCSFQIVFTLFDVGIGFTRAIRVDSFTFQLINPNFRVGQLLIFVKSKVVFILCFEWKYIINIFCWLLLSSTVVPIQCSALISVQLTLSIQHLTCPSRAHAKYPRHDSHRYAPLHPIKRWQPTCHLHTSKRTQITCPTTKCLPSTWRWPSPDACLCKQPTKVGLI